MAKPGQNHRNGEMDRPRPGHYRAWRWTVILLGSIALNIGCSPISMFNFLLTPWIDNKVPPKCKLTPPEDAKEVTVAVVSDLPTVQISPDCLPVERELCDRFMQHLRKRFEENKEKVTFIPYTRVKSYLNQHSDNRLLSAQEIGKHFKTDYVINLEIDQLALFERGSWNRLYRGNIEIAVKTFDVHKPADEALIFEDIYRCEYPGRGPEDANDTSLTQFRSRFTNRVARDLARWFAAFPVDERVDLE